MSASVVTIDASIWAAAHLASDAGRSLARRLIGAVLRSGARIEQPTLTLVELPSALRRRGTDPARIQRHVAQLAGVREGSFHDLDLRAAIDAAGAAIGTGLRAGDAIYLATARHTGATLITFDQELLAAKVPGVRVMSPETWLAAYG
jgi:predicted nucleic acid-binding protein